MKNKRLNKENILTIPNLLSLFRLLLIPVILWLYCVRKAYLPTLLVIALSGFTDILDGKIARKYNMVSDVGKVLDPVADKLTQASLVICLLSRYKWMWGLLVIFILKESLMLLWGYLALRYTDTVNSAKWYGKLSTVVLYAVMMILVLFTDIPEMGANILIALCGAVILMSLILYGRFYHGVFRQDPSGGAAKKVLNTVRKCVLVLVWAAIIAVCIVYHKEISAEGIARFTPRNPLLAAVFMLLLFALKSMSVVIYSGLLYAANGMIFRRCF